MRLFYSVIIAFYVVLFNLNARNPVWEKTPGVNDPEIRLLTTFGDNLLLASVNRYRLAVSSDQGYSWQIVADYSDKETEFNSALSTKDGTLFVGANNSLLKSIDKGQSWLYVGSLVTAKSGVRKLALGHGGDVYAVTVSAGIYSSSNNGQDWLPVSGIDSWNIKDIIIDNRGCIYVESSNKGYLFSKDNGESWNSVNAFGRILLAVDSLGRLYFTGGSPKYNSLDFTDDYGKKFTKLLVSDSLNDRITSAWTTGDKEIIASTYKELLYRSTDRGATWQKFVKGLPQGTINSFFTFNNGAYLSAHSAGSVYSYDFNNSAWKVIYCPPVPWEKNQQVHIAAVSPDDTIYISVDNKGTFKSGDKGRTWLASAYSYIGVQSDSKGVFYARERNYTINKSTDKGLTWKSILPVNYYFNNGVYDFCLDENDNIYVVHKAGIYISRDSGENWEIDSSAATANMSLFKIFRLNGTFYASGNNCGFVKSYDCKTWQSLDSNFRPTILKVNKSGDFFTFRNNKLLVSSDSGKNWIEKYSSSGTQLNDILITENGNLYLSGQLIASGKNQYKFGVAQSLDNGNTWTICNEGLNDSAEVNSVVIDKEGYLFALTNTGVFRSSKSVTSAENDIPAKTNNFNVHPNPASDFIILSSGDDNIISACLYNMLGEKVMAFDGLNDRYCRIDVSGFPTGVYYISIRTDSGIKWGKFVIYR